MNQPHPKRFSSGERIGLVVGAIVSGVFASGCLVSLPSQYKDWSSGRDWGSFASLAVGISLAGAACWLTYYLISLLWKNAEPVVKPVACQCCGRRVPIIRASLHRHIGAVILMFHKSLSGYFCRDCISRTFWEYTPITFFFGWWGLLSLIATPVVLTNNCIVYARSLFMPATQSLPTPLVL